MGHVLMRASELDLTKEEQDECLETVKMIYGHAASQADPLREQAMDLFHYRIDADGFETPCRELSKSVPEPNEDYILHLRRLLADSSTVDTRCKKCSFRVRCFPGQPVTN
jgi:MoaA/NifB/PqqE/SkfB family radical SAM enzyme